MKLMRLAIVVPLLNEAQLIQRHMQRFKALPCDELYFVDGGSNDATCQIVMEAGVSLLSSVKGRSVQMNAGAASCKSDILLFIHADTLLSSSDIELIKKVMQDKKIVGGRFDIRLSGDAFAFRIIEFFINWRSRITKISTGDQCQFVRRSVFEEMGGFPKQALMEDIEFSKRLKGYGKVACLKNKVLTSSRRWEKHGIIRTVWLMWKLRFLYAWGKSPKALAEMYRNAR